MEDAAFLATYNARGKFYHQCIEKIYNGTFEICHHLIRSYFYALELSEIKSADKGPATTTPQLGKSIHKNANYAPSASRPFLQSTFTSYPLFFDFIMRHQFNDSAPSMFFIIFIIIFIILI
jgi:hypothetical protein